MSYRFDGVDDQAQFTMVAATNITGAWTFAQVIKLDIGVTWQAFLGNDHATTGSEIATGRHNSGVIATYAAGGVGTTTGGAISNADGWMLVASRRPAGASQTVTHTKYPIGGSPTHTAASGTRNNPVTQAGGKIVFGQIDGSDWFDGWLWTMAEWTTNLSDADLESLVTNFTRANWLSLSPAALWDATDQFATDWTGNGASRSSITGTTLDADNPAGSGSWAGAAAATSLVVPRRPHRGLIMR